MPKSGTHVLTAAVALLALVSPFAHGLDASHATRYASVDPSAFRQSALPANAMATASNSKAQVQKKPKAAKTRIFAGLNNFRSPAARALDRIKQSERNCGVGVTACPAAFRSGHDQSQAWSHATLRRPTAEAAENSVASAPTDSAPALVRPYTDVPGLIPGRESSYKLSLNMPLGRYENVLLQANVRKNAFNTQNSSDSTLRADWSLRF
jgi:hypothetical protein